MYFNLRKGNVKQMLQDYQIYFVTLTVSASLFYAFLSLSSPANNIIANGTKYSIELFQETINLAIYIISLIFFVLVNYVNNHMLKKRSREFAVYMLLGMEQKKIAFSYLIETLEVGLLSVLFGTLIGTILSGVLTSIVLISTEGVFEYNLKIYPDVFFRTIVYFGLVFCVVGLFNSKKLTKKRLLDLMNAEKVSEGHIKRKGGYVIGLILSIVSFSIAAIGIRSYLVAGEVNIETLPSAISNRYQTVIGISLVIGIFSGYYAISYLIKVFKEKSRKYKYKNLNIVFINNLFSKISSNAKIVACATIAMAISILGFVVAPVLADISEEYLVYRMPYSLMINNSYRYIDNLDDIPQIDYSFVEEILNEYDIEIMESCTQQSYFVWRDSFENVEERENKWDMPRLAIPLSDYNKMREMAGYAPIILEENEFAVQISNEVKLENYEEQINQANNELVLDDGTRIRLAEDAIYNVSIGNYLYNFGISSSFVFPDSLCEKLDLAKTCYYAQTIDTIPLDACEEIERKIKDTFKHNYSYLYDIYEIKYCNDKDYQDFINPIRFWTEELNSVKLGSVCCRLLGVYIGVIFFMICLTVLALQQLSDADNNKAQYKVLYYLGVGKENIHHLITKQITFFFMIPCVLAILGAGVGIYVFMLRFGHKIEAYIGTFDFMLNIITAVALLIIIFIAYFLSTIKGYWYNIKSVFERNYRRRIPT